MVDKTLFAKQPEKRDFLKNTSRRKNGDMLFSKLGIEIEFAIRSWEWYTPQEGQEQIALVLGIPDGREFLWPLGSTANWRIGELGFESPDDIEGLYMTIEAYETGSEDQYAIGKRIVAISKDGTLEDWTAEKE